MTITGTTASNYFETKYGDSEKYLSDKTFQDFTGIEFLIYLEEYIDNFLEKQNKLSKEMLLEIIRTLNSLFKAGILKQINYILLTLVIDYKIIYDSKSPDISFDEYVIKKLKMNGNHKEWLGK